MYTINLSLKIFWQSTMYINKIYTTLDELLFGNHFYYEFKLFAHTHKIKTQKSKVLEVPLEILRISIILTFQKCLLIPN